MWVAEVCTASRGHRMALYRAFADQQSENASGYGPN